MRPTAHERPEVRRLRLRLAIVLAPLCLTAAGAIGDDESVCCPRCRVRCEFSKEVEGESTECFETECQWLCVPRVRLPWTPCCVPPKAFIKKVNTLKIIEVECPRCKYKWKAVCDCPACNLQPADSAAPPRCAHLIPPTPVDFTERRQTAPNWSGRLPGAGNREFLPRRPQ